ncbi:MAG: hypothetical protein JWN72_1064, partial [Thermoleophilia bacterium]|nr:hypothetical protein [Thermoleophilia bacterium]
QAGAATDTTGAGAAAANASPLAALGLDKLPSWLGPLTTVAGGGAAIYGFSKAASATAQAAGKGYGLLKFGGIAAALAGIGITYMASKAAGAKAKEAEIAPQITAYNTQVTQAFADQKTQYETVIAQLQQQAQAGGAGQADPGAGTGQTGTTNPDGTPTPGTGTGTETSGGTGQTGASQVPSGVVIDNPAKAVPTGTLTAGAWSPSALVGSSIDLTQGNGADASNPIAKAGTFVVSTGIGDVNGYATVDEANAAAKAAMSTQTTGVPYLRFGVIEHGGKFYGVLAKASDGVTQGKPLDAATGTVAAWNALNFVASGNSGSWQAYSWSKTAGESAVDVGYTAEPFAAGAAATSAAQPGATTTSTTAPGTAPTASTAGGTTTATTGTPAAAVAFDPNSVIGTSFAINAASTAEGDLVRGGALQVQGFASSSTGGFGTPEEAAVAARTERAAIGTDPWKRVVTMQGADHKFYVYTGSIVARETAAATTAAPVHVFGSGIAEYFDGTSASWKAVRDAK